MNKLREAVDCDCQECAMGNLVQRQYDRNLADAERADELDRTCAGLLWSLAVAGAIILLLAVKLIDARHALRELRGELSTQRPYAYQSYTR